jgi:osmotically-inducible protein OsmY
MSCDDANRRTGTTQRDREFEARVNRVLWSYSPLRESRCPIIAIARGEVVELSGTVRTERMKRTALRLVGTVPGVQARDNLVSDESLEQEIHQRMVQNPSTALSAKAVTVRSVLGAVYLRGQVESATVREEVGRIASQVPGVQVVVNKLTVQNHNAAQLEKAA